MQSYLHYGNVDVGSSGRAGGAGMFFESSLKDALDNLTLAVNMEGIPSKIHYHIVADGALPLCVNILKPYPQRNLDKPSQI